MRLYDNAPDSNYKELQTFYPVWYRDVLEMDALWRVFGEKLDDVQNGIIRAVNNCFIRSADEPTISSLETFLYITYNGVRSLDERRTVIAALFAGNSHMGEPEIREIIGIFTGGEVAVTFSRGTIGIMINLPSAAQFQIEDCRSVLLNRIPAHLALMMTVIYTAPPIRVPLTVTGATFPGVMRTTLPAYIPTHTQTSHVRVGAVQSAATRTMLLEYEGGG